MKWKNHADNKGFLNMKKKGLTMGVPRNKFQEGTKKFAIPTKRTKIKA